MADDTARYPMAGSLLAPTTPEGVTLLDLLAGHLPAIRAGAEECDRAGTFPGEVFKAFGDSGVMSATVPRELGGLGIDRLHDVATALCAVAEVDASTALALHAQFSRGLTFSWEWTHGDAHTRQLAGRVLSAMAAGSPVAGGSKDHPSTVTTLTSDGAAGWRLTGRTTMVTMAPVATYIITVAQTRGDGPSRLALPVVTPQTPGVTVLDNWDGLGMRASGTVDVVFDNAPVPATDVLLRGEVGAQDDSALAGQTVSSITMLGIYVGVAQAARDHAVATVRRRASIPAAVRTLVAEIDARLAMLRFAAAGALTNADILAVDPAIDLPLRGRMMMVPFQYAKLLVNRHAPAIVDDCLTLVGGAAYTNGHPLSRMHRDVRANAFMQPYNYADGVDFLSAHALGLAHDSNYMSARAARASQIEGGTRR